MTEELQVTDNWTRNWQASIAVKISALVLWVLIMVVFVASVFLFRDVEKNLLAEYEDSADQIAYRVAQVVARENACNDAVLEEQLSTLLHPQQFYGLVIQCGNRSLEVGTIPPGGGKLRRRLPITDPGSGQPIFLDLYYPQLHEIVQQKRNRMVIAIFVTLLVFGVFLTWAVRTIVHMPLQQLVSATRQISAGDRDVRLNMQRQDEFGHLSRFFNLMLDKLMEQQNALKEAVDRANTASKAKSAFLANMSHELRTPLNAIIGYSEMLQEDASSMGATRCVPDLEKIHIAGRHLLSLINNILDLSKIEAGKIEIEWSSFPVSQLVRDVATTIQPLLDKNNNTLVVCSSDELNLMESDQTRLRQVLFNLLGNATKFTENGQVKLSVTRLKQDGVESVEFVVEDSGIGIPEDKLHRLFGEFSQVDSSATRKYGGTGLGLAISRRFCQMLGGDITVQSEVGVGSLFRVVVPTQRLSPVEQHVMLNQTSDPADAKQLRLASQPSADVATERRRRVSRVLVVDDDPFVRDLVTRYLAREGFEVRSAENGEEGLELAASLRPDAITLEIRLPDIDGWTVLSRLKQDPQLARIPVVVLSMDEGAQRGMALGASHYLAKPIDGENLLKTVKRCLRRSGSSQTVLVVDDDPSIRHMVARTLTGQGVEVIPAVDGEQALACLDKRSLSLILLDLHLPRMSGFDFLLELRKRFADRSVPVVVMTGLDLSETQRSELTGKVEHILQKGAHLREDVLQQLKELVCTT